MIFFTIVCVFSKIYSSTSDSISDYPKESNSGLSRSVELQDISKITAEGPNKMIVITISNSLEDENLYGGSHYSFTGFSRTAPAPVIHPGTQEMCVFQKRGFTATGTVGLTVYRIGEDVSPGVRFAVVWSVPFDTISAANWFGIKFLGEHERANKALYDDIYNDPTWGQEDNAMKKGYFYANDGRAVIVQQGSYIILASMSDFSHASLRVTVLQSNASQSELKKKMTLFKKMDINWQTKFNNMIDSIRNVRPLH